MLGAFRNATEGTDGFDTLKASFPEGALGPATVVIDRQDGPITEEDIAAAQEALGEVPDIGTITDVTGQSEDGQAAAFNVAFPDDPYSNDALDRTDEMRDALAALAPGGCRATWAACRRSRPTTATAPSVTPARSCRSCCS